MIQLPGQQVSMKELCVMHCELDGATIEEYMEQLSPDPLLGRGLFVSLSILAPFLDDTTLHNLFTRQCALLRACLASTPLVRVLLKAVVATVLGLKKTIPRQARTYFQGLDDGDDEHANRDLPISFSLPHRHEVRLLLSGEDDENLDELGVRLSYLVSRWTNLSVDSP